MSVGAARRIIQDNSEICLGWPLPLYPLNTLLENVPVLSKAPWNKPVDCALLGVSGAWWC